MHRSYDQDSDADLFRENIIFGKRSTRYLCISKSEGLEEHLVESIKVIGEKDMPPIGYSMLNRTRDSESKAWRKKQIVYKVARRQGVVEAITDIILCTKTKLAPNGFQSAGEINGVLICYKSGPLAHRPPPDVPKSPALNTTSDSLGAALENLNINLTNSLYPSSPGVGYLSGSNDYENIVSPKRPAPRPPVINGTLGGTNTDADGIPFVLNPSLNNKPEFQVNHIKVFQNLFISLNLFYFISDASFQFISRY